MSLTAYTKNKLSDYKNCLSELKFDESESKGRLKKYDEDDVYHELINPFELDKIKLLESKARRRQADKTQVHSMQINRHVRTRLSHTDGVQATSMIISEILGLNTLLCESITECHDIGHTPYGHSVESLVDKRIKQKVNEKAKFHHALNSVIVAEFVERKGKGLNLTYETLEGTLLHSRSKGPLYTDDKLPQEYAVVMFADKISYVFSDFNDALRKNLITKKQNPELFTLYEQIGNNQRSCTLKCITELCKESKEEKTVSFLKSKTADTFKKLLDLMYKQVYETVDWAVQKQRVNKTINVLELATITDYNQILNLNKTNLPNPYITLSLLTDNYITDLGDKSINVSKLVEMKQIDTAKMIIDYTNEEITLSQLLTKTNLGELVPNLMNHNYDFNELFTKYGENNDNFFRDVLVPVIKKY